MATRGHISMMNRNGAAKVEYSDGTSAMGSIEIRPGGMMVFVADLVPIYADAAQEREAADQAAKTRAPKAEAAA